VLLPLNHPPHLQSTTGATSPNPKLTNPSKLFPTPRTSYIRGAKSGNEKPAMVLTKAAAPVALAAYVV